MSGTQSALMGSGGFEYWAPDNNYTRGKTYRSPADHQLYVRAVTGAGSTDPASDATNWRPDGGRAMKSVQRGVAIAPGNVTIAAVNLAKTFMAVNTQTGTVNATNDYAANSGCANLASSTQVAITGASPTQKVCWEVIEFY